MAIVKITDDHFISNKGIESIKHEGSFIIVRYITGYCETIDREVCSMSSLLHKLGRMPGEPKGHADSP